MAVSNNKGCITAKDIKMKKLCLVLLITVLASAFCFAQTATAESKALQGTWVLIAGMNDKECFGESDVKAENLEVFYIFKGNELTIKKNGETIGPLPFNAVPNYIFIGPANEGKLPFSLQGKILIIHEGGFAFVYRKK
jgi:hypothetical protein